MFFFFRSAAVRAWIAVFLSAVLLLGHFAETLPQSHPKGESALSESVGTPSVLNATGAEASRQAPIPSASVALSAKAALLMEYESGAILYQKEGNLRLPMASTTKLMTALVALRLGSVDQIITVSPAAVGIEGSSVYLTAGEQLTLGQLLAALLLSSANDAAVAIAIGLSGSISAFAEEMNRLSAEMGLTDSHFSNPHGLDAEGHYTTCHDLALIGRAVWQNPFLAETVSQKKMTIPLGGAPDLRLLVNHNKLLSSFPDCCGGKTGYTRKSGRCLVSFAERDGLRLIAVTLSAPDDWKDHKCLLEAGFSAYRRVVLWRGGDDPALSLPVVGGRVGSVALSAPDSLSVLLPASPPSLAVSVKAELPAFDYAPISTEKAVGRLSFFADCNHDGCAEYLGSVPLFPTENAESAPYRFVFFKRIFSS